MSEFRLPILGIVGPTAVGKSEVALALARKLPAEIISVDSMQVYREMDIGTGKPSLEIRQAIPHHGLDLVEPEERFNVGRYVDQVGPVVKQLLADGKIPILVGGSGLYLRGLLDGVCDAPPENSGVRSALTDWAKTTSPERVHARLQAVDPLAADRIHPNNLKRVVRALEVYEVSGQPISEWQQETQPPFAGYPLQLWGLQADSAWLQQRIEARVDAWMVSGWLQEAERLHHRVLSVTAREALGYRELFNLLDGSLSYEAAIAQIKLKTCQYAKRQRTWFRKESRIQWIPAEENSAEQIAEIVKAGARC